MQSVTDRKDLNLARPGKRHKDWQKRREQIIMRRKLTHIRPLGHGHSLLNEISNLPDVEVKQTTKGGVSFTINSGYYRPDSVLPWNAKEVIAQFL